MCLLSYVLDTVGLFLRVWLWISVPMAVLILLVASWMNYRRQVRPKVGLNLAIEGWAGDGSAEETAAGETRNPEPVAEGATAFGGIFSGDRESGPADSPVREVGEDEVETGREAIYRGILWMKEKYEQYREQADRRYEKLKEELGRSERRYLELVAAMEQTGKGTAVNLSGSWSMANQGGIVKEAAETVPGDIRMDDREKTAGEVDMDKDEMPAGVLQTELRSERRRVKELERELHAERSKVEELVIRLQANSQLLTKIYQELDKSLQLERVAT